MITDAAPLEALYSELESTANMLRGMCLDPTIPAHAKSAMQHRIVEIDTLLQTVEIE